MRQGVEHVCQGICRVCDDTSRVRVSGSGKKIAGHGRAGFLANSNRNLDGIPGRVTSAVEPPGLIWRFLVLFAVSERYRLMMPPRAAQRPERGPKLWHPDRGETEGVPNYKPLTAQGALTESVGVSAVGSTICAFWMLSFCSKSKRCRIAGRRLLSHDHCHASRRIHSVSRDA